MADYFWTNHPNRYRVFTELAPVRVEGLLLSVRVSSFMNVMMITRFNCVARISILDRVMPRVFVDTRWLRRQRAPINFRKQKWQTNKKGAERRTAGRLFPAVAIDFVSFFGVFFRISGNYSLSPGRTGFSWTQSGWKRVETELEWTETIGLPELGMRTLGSFLVPFTVHRWRWWARCWLAETEHVTIGPQKPIPST